jgi:hypothetical protein
LTSLSFDPAYLLCLFSISIPTSSALLNFFSAIASAHFLQQSRDDIELMSKGPDLLQAVRLRQEVFPRITRFPDLFHCHALNVNSSFAKAPPIS